MPTKDQIEKIKKIDNPLVRKKYTQFLQLPKGLQEAMFDTKTADIIDKVAKENNLNSDQLWQFSYLVGMIFLGDLHIAEFIKKIQEKCKLSHEASRNLARQINKELFLSLKEDLKIVHKIPKWPREDEEKTPSVKPPIVNKPTPPPVHNRIRQEEEKRTINLRK